jgi:hypothetical protein
MTMKKIFLILSLVMIGACATITNDPMVPVALSFGNGENGACVLSNKRQVQTVNVPSISMVRRSDDVLRYDCTTESNKKALGSIPSKIGAKIVASAVFIDFGITDAITDKHREYPASFVIPVSN